MDLLHIPDLILKSYVPYDGQNSTRSSKSNGMDNKFEYNFTLSLTMLLYFPMFMFSFMFVIMCVLFPSRSWSYDSWILNYLCHQCLSPPTLWVRILHRRGVIDTTLCDKVCQWLATGRRFLWVLRFPPPKKLTATI